jgi:hypothetical protein
MRILGALALLVLLTNCSSADEPVDVPWSQYAPQVRERVEAAAEAEDCDALGREFLAASETSDVHRDRWGEGNGKLMQFIDEAMKDAGCP